MAAKIATITILIILALLFVSERISLSTSMELVNQSLVSRAVSIAQTTSHLTAEALTMNFYRFLQEVVLEIKRANADVRYALITDAEGNIMAHTDESRLFTALGQTLVDALTMERRENLLEVRAPIRVNEDMAGNIVFAIDTQSLIHAKTKLQTQTLLKFAGVVVVGVLLSLWVSRRIVKPLNLLSRYAQKLSQQDFSADTVKLTEATALPLQSRDEVGQLARSFVFMTEALRTNVHKLMETTATKERIEGELNVARDIQMGLLPKTFPPFPERSEFDLHATIHPAKQVGGDLFDFFFTDDNTLCFALGDVADKGVPAALFMAITMALLRNLAQENHAPAEMMRRINNALSTDNPRCMFVTLIIGNLNLRTGELCYANGGHNPPVYLSKRDGAARFLNSAPLPPVGVMSDIEYDDTYLQLETGDFLLLYTDGVTEATNAAEQLFSEERLLAQIDRDHDAPVATIVTNVLTSIRQHVQDFPQSDDIAMLALRYCGVAMRNTRRVPQTVAEVA